MIGIFGGTFDPIHYGHLRTVLDVHAALQLEHVRLVPLRDPPHRPAPETTPQQRLELLQAAVAGDPRLVIDRCELERQGKSYTVETLRAMQQTLGDTTLALIMGLDAFNGFPLWHQPEQILELAHLVVMQRPGEAQPTHHAARLTLDPTDLARERAGRILLQPVVQLDISATRIRQMLSQGASVEGLLPAACLELILAQGLYGSGKTP